MSFTETSQSVPRTALPNVSFWPTTDVRIAQDERGFLARAKENALKVYSFCRKSYRLRRRGCVLSVSVAMDCDRVAEIDDSLGEWVQLRIGGVECHDCMRGLGAVDQEVDLVRGEGVAGVDSGLKREELLEVFAVLVADQESDGGEVVRGVHTVRIDETAARGGGLTG